MSNTNFRLNVLSDLFIFGMKGEFMDSFSLKAIAIELDTYLRGGTIEKVSQPQKSMILLEIKPPRLSSRVSREIFQSLPRLSSKKVFRLLISVDHKLPRVHLTGSELENPKTAPPFCMLLRKYMVGGRVVSVTLRGIERVLHLVVEKRDPVGRIQRFTLIGEMMGRHSNLFVLDSRTGIILDVLKPVSPSKSSVRDLQRNAPYAAPPEQEKEDPLIIGEDRFIELSERARKRSKETSVSPRWLVDTFAGFGPDVAGYIADRGKKGSLWEVFQDTWERFVEGRFSPGIMTLKEGDEGVLWVLPVPKGMCFRPFKSANAAADELYGRSWQNKKLEETRSALRKKTAVVVKRKRRAAEQVRGEVARAEEADAHQRKGELLLTNLESVLRGAESVRLRDSVSGDEIEIPLNAKLNPQQNAERYFSRAKKLRRAASHGRGRLKELEGEIKRFESLIRQMDSADRLDSLDPIAAEVQKLFQNKKEKEPVRKKSVEGKSDRGRKGGGKPAEKNPQRKKVRAGKESGVADSQFRAEKKGSVQKRRVEGIPAAQPGKKGDRSDKSDQPAPEDGTRQSLKDTRTPEDPPKAATREKSSNYRSFNLEGGWEIHVGKNDRGNDHLLRRVAKGEDLWLHAQGVPGSHVIVHHGERGREVPPDVLENAAQLAAYYSKGKSSGKQAVDYLSVKQLRRIKGGRPGQVTFNGQRTITVSPNIPRGLREYGSPPYDQMAVDDAV